MRKILQILRSGSIDCTRKRSFVGFQMFSFSQINSQCHSVLVQHLSLRLLNYQSCNRSASYLFPILVFIPRSSIWKHPSSSIFFSHSSCLFILIVIFNYRCLTHLSVTRSRIKNEINMHQDGLHSNNECKAVREDLF